MKTNKDTDLREALRRREAKRQKVEVPADFLDNVMQGIEDQRPRRTARIALAVLAVAASVALVFVLNNEPKTTPAVTADDTTRYIKREDSLRMTVPVALTVKQQAAESQKRRPAVRSTQHTKVTDDLDDYVAQIESDLADVRDSCYLAQVERMIADNEELQQLMNEMTNQKQ